MKLLIYDCECNSLDTDSGYIQELAWAIYDTDSWRLLKSASFIIDWPTMYTVDPGALAVTGLSREFCAKFGARPHEVFTNFLFDLEIVDALCGHNALSYDRPMMMTNIKRSMMFESGPGTKFMDFLHIDTLLDCPYPAHLKQHALKYLAYDHGYILSDAHQALADVFACKAILAKYDFNEVLAIAKTPIVTLTTKVEWADTEGRDRIKNARFYWNPTKKLWEKRIREYHLPGIQMSLGDSISLSKD